jgi:hypothetical protein
MRKASQPTLELDHPPALVQGRQMNTFAANPMAIALSPFFAPGVNTFRAAFQVGPL